MGKIKNLLIGCAEELGIPDTQDPAVMALANAKMKAMVKPKQMCERCQEHVAEEDSFLCGYCEEDAYADFETVVDCPTCRGKAYGDPSDMCDLHLKAYLDEMEKYYDSQREMESGYKHHDGPEGL